MKAVKLVHAGIQGRPLGREFGGEGAVLLAETGIDPLAEAIQTRLQILAEGMCGHDGPIELDPETSQFRHASGDLGP